MQQQNFMQRFRNLIFVMGVFSILALLPELAAAQQITQATPGGRGGERYGSFTFNPATVSWKTTQAAIPLVEQRLAQLEAQLAIQSPGSPAHFQANVRYSFYKLVLSELEVGVAVKDAVVVSGKKVANDFSAVSLLNTVVAEAAELLTN